MLCNALPVLICGNVPYSSLEITYFSEITLESNYKDVWLHSVLVRKPDEGEVLACAVAYHDLSPLLGEVHCRITDARQMAATVRRTGCQTTERNMMFPESMFNGKYSSC